MGQRFQHDIKYEITADKAVGVNSLFSATVDDYQVIVDNESGSDVMGCSGSISARVPMTLTMAAILILTIAQKVGRKEKVE